VGRIGREMIPRAKAFGMPVVAWSRSLTPEAARELGIEHQASPIDVARAADIVSVHVAANAQTRGLIDANFFDAMRPGAYFINTSRAEVVDQVALVGRCAAMACAPAWMCSPTSRPAARAISPTTS
jgi:D-3-phosphoglycerate dehydrogenase